jgi:glycosyltransferase involved in cell wall biosynthesis
LKLPHISICICTHNRPTLFKKTLDSVINQSFRKTSIIVVDDSSDKEYAEKTILECNDERIKYIRNKENKGLAYNRDLSIKKSVNADFWTFIDDDDEWHTSHLQKFVNSISNKVDVYINHSENRNEIFSLITAFELGITPPVGGQIYNLDLLKKYKISYGKIKTGVDHSLWIKMLKINPFIKTFTSPKICRNYHKTTMTIDENRINNLKDSFEQWESDYVEVFGKRKFQLFKRNYLDHAYYRFFVHYLKHSLNLRFCLFFRFKFLRLWLCRIFGKEFSFFK